jgi:hypothetical protein
MDLTRFIFTCFNIFADTTYSHHSIHIRFKIFSKIRIQIFDLMQNYKCRNKYSSEQIFSSHILLLANIRFKIFILKRICAYKRIFTYKQIFAYKRISACKYFHTSKDSLANIRLISLQNIR